MKTNKHTTPLFNRLLKTTLAAGCLLVAPGIFSQAKKGAEQQQQLTLLFNLTAGGAKLLPGNTYTNPFGERYTVQKFKYYITQLELQDSTDMSTQFFPDNYFLIDADDTGTQRITIPLSIKHLTSVSFVIGVDSSANVSGKQEGTLDPGYGMFWTWNTGYIYMKLLATSPAAKVPANTFTFDIGGFKPGESASRKIGFYIRHKLSQDVHNIVFGVDVNKLFNGAHDIKIAEHPLCHEPGALAMQLADNYATMFSVQQVTK